MLLTALLTISLLHTSTSINPECTLYKEIFDYHNKTYFKAEFAFEVVEKIFNAFKQWFYTITFCDFTYFENRILKYIENYDYGYPVMLLNGCRNLNNTKVKPKINRHGQTAYVVTSDELSLDGSEFVIETFIRTGVFKPRSAVIFVINTPIEMDSYFFYNMKLHFQLLISRRITNSIIVLYSGRLRMFTFNPFSNEIKDITDVSEVSRLLAKQYNDLFGHELRLSVFRKIYVSDDTGPLYCNSRLAITVMEILNATCIPLPPRDGNTVGDLLTNGTATGVTADLIDGYTDLELNSRILKNSYYGYIDTTYPLVQDELCFLVKKSLKQSAFTTTLKLISIDMLIVFIFNVIFFITAALSTRAIEKRVWNLDERRTTSSTVVDLIKCFIRQTVDIKFMGHIFRFIALLIMMYSLVVNCAIDGIITSAITYPRYKPDINTLSDLVQTNLTFVVHNRDIYIYKKSLSSDYYNIIKRIEVFDDAMIKEAIVKRQFQYAILLRKSDAQYISRKQSNMRNGRPLFHTVEECPVPCFIVYGLRYGSPYLPKLNKILHHLNQGGILQYWSRSDEYTLYRTNIKNFLYTAENKERKPLNTGNVKEIFIVLLVGILFSIFAFVFEFLFYHIERLNLTLVNTIRLALFK